MKKFILNADDFGISKAHNKAVLFGYHNGFLTSASLCANGSCFNAAVNEIIPECPNLSVGINLNISHGFALTKAPLLTNKKGQFNRNFLTLCGLSANQKALEQIKFEFRTQIETVMNYTKVGHIDSQEHIHAIPGIFNIVAELAVEYNIPVVRTHFEELYFVPSAKKHLNFQFPYNIFKMFLLNSFSIKNKKKLIENNLKTNDFIIGICYNNFTDSNTIEYGLNAIEDDGTVEAVIRPCYYSNYRNNQNYKEFLITQNKELKDKILRMGYEITNYRNA